MTNERDVKGIVSWKSIGADFRSASVHVQAVNNGASCGDKCYASLFTAIPLIMQHEYVLVRGPDQRIVGIVTTSDLSLQFLQMTEPFMLLGEIENHIRRLISSHFNQDELSAAKDSIDGPREIETAADLTFGEYKRLLEEPSRWERLGGTLTVSYSSACLTKCEKSGMTSCILIRTEFLKTILMSFVISLDFFELFKRSEQRSPACNTTVQRMADSQR